MYLTSNHKRLSLVSLVVFVLLSLFIAVIPAVNIQHFKLKISAYLSVTVLQLI